MLKCTIRYFVNIKLEALMSSFKGKFYKIYGEIYR